MPHLTRRRDPDRPETWLIFADGVEVGSIGFRDRHFISPAWIWSIRLAQNRSGAAHTFEAARAEFEAALRTGSSDKLVEALAVARFEKAAARWMYVMHDRFLKTPTEMANGVSRCYCGARITIRSADEHILAVHMDST